MATLDKLESREYVPKQWEEVGCPVCHSARKKIYERYGNKWQYTHNLCLDCKMVYCSPRPKYDADFLFNAYEYYADDRSILDMTQSAFERHAYDSCPGAEMELQEIQKYDLDKHSFLDVGCATGEYLFASKKFYTKCYGLEVSATMSAFVREKLQISVFNEKFENLKENTRFSCIHMSHVIEHIPDPYIWLAKAKKILTQNGILVIKVPNIFSPDRKFKVLLKKIRLRKGKWESWRTPDHLYEPSIPGFRKLFELAGFEILKEYTYSRKNLMSEGFWGKIYHHFFKFGNNIKFIVKPI